MVDIIKLWTADKTVCDPITEFYDLTITESLNTVYSIEFTVPLTSEVAKQIKIEGFLECDGKRFTIKERAPKLADKTLTVYGIGEVDGLKYGRCDSFSISKATAYEAITQLLRDTSTGWSIVYGSSSESERPTAKRTLKLSKTETGTVWDILQKVIDKWHVEIDFDCVNHTMKLYKRKRLGQQSALTVFFETLNLLDFERSEDSNGVVNSIRAFGKDGLTIKGAEREDGSTVNVDYVNELNDLGKEAREIPKIMRGYYLDAQEDDKQELYNAVVDYLEANCYPERNYTINVADLTNENPNHSEFYEVRLGDTIGIVSSTVDARYNLRVVKITRKPNEPDSMEIELTNKRASVATSTAQERRILNGMIDTYNAPSVGDTILIGSRVINADNVQLNAITADLLEGGEVIEAKPGESMVEALLRNAVEETQSNLENASGYLRINYDANNRPVSLDAVSDTNQNNIFRFFAGGLYASTNGGETFSKVAIDTAGNIVASNIASGSIISNSVTMSNLKVTGGSINMVSDGTTSSGIIINHNFSNASTTIAGDYVEVRGNSAGENTLIQPTGIYTPTLTTGDISATGSTIYATTGVFYGNVNGNKVFATGAGTSDSDTPNARIVNTGQICYIKSASMKKFKHDIKPIDEVIDAHQLYDAEVVAFKYNDDYLGENDVRHGKDLAGFIVDDLINTAPGIVSYGDDGKPENWNPRYAIPMMVKLIQEQNERIKALEAKLGE